ncbi:MAG: hypothetical protein IPL77_10870 [Flavobacteriales bacterium]|nr:hypothetical protein [Flavobacteriales bacterium]
MPTISANTTQTITLAASTLMRGIGAAVLSWGTPLQTVTHTAGDEWHFGPFTAAQAVSIHAQSLLTYSTQAVSDDDPVDKLGLKFDGGLTSAQVQAVRELVTNTPVAADHAHFRWIFGDSSTGDSVTTATPVTFAGIDARDWTDATLHVICTGAGTLAMAASVGNDGAGVETTLFAGLSAGTTAVKLPKGQFIDFTATATSATMTVRAYVVAQSLTSRQVAQIGVMRHAIGDSSAGISVAASGTQTSNPIDMQQIDRATAILRIKVTGTGTAKISAQGSRNGVDDLYSLGDLVTGMVVATGTYSYALSSLAVGFPFLTLTATETGGANPVVVTAYIEGTEPAAHVVTADRRKVAIVVPSNFFASGTWVSSYSKPWRMIYGMLTRMGYDVDVLAPSDTSTIFDGTARRYEFIVMPHLQASAAWATWTSGPGKAIGRIAKGEGAAPVFILGISQSANSAIRAATGADAIVDALGNKRTTIGGGLLYVNNSVGYGITAQGHMTSYEALGTITASGSVAAWRFRGTAGWVYCNAGYVASGTGSALPVLLGLAISAGHIEEPPRKLAAVIDIDDCPDCSGSGGNGTQTVADLNRIYTAMTTLQMPCSFGIRPEDIDSGRMPTAVSAWVAARTANHGGLLYPIEHEGSWYWKDGTKAVKDAAYRASIPTITGVGINVGTDAAQVNAWGYTYFNNNACDLETLELGSPETSYLASPTEVVRQAGYGWQVVRLDARGVNNTECPGEPEYVFGVGRQRGTTLAASATAIASSEKTIAYTDDGAGTQRLGLQLGAFQNQCLAHGTHMYIHGSNCYDGHDGGNAPGTAFLESLASVWGYMGRVVEFKHGAESAV